MNIITIQIQLERADNLPILDALKIATSMTSDVVTALENFGYVRSQVYLNQEAVDE